MEKETDGGAGKVKKTRKKGDKRIERGGGEK